ncbi:C4-dicarboxylate ABC transporter [Inquilinus sp. KBS0705]|nr:C4-dicarboxylate ABC transporter [Inquilinus sp. KBS0705]
MSTASSISKQLKAFPPVYFALVMATGIISIGCHLLKAEVPAMILFWLNNVNYVALLTIFIGRMIWYPQQVMADLSDSAQGAGFLTFVAGSGMLGVQYCLIAKVFLPAMVLWVIALVAWVYFLYGFLFIRITGAYKPDPENGLNGGWLLMVVSTQSLSILGSQLAAHLPFSANITLFFTLSAYLLGLFFYIMLIAIIFLRMTFDPMKAQEFIPPYWVLMGAAAITALGGAVFIQSVNTSGVYTDWIPVIKVLSLMAWIIASWWIPLLAMLEIWRHFAKKVPFKYQPANWDTVFTLGMYTVSSYQLAKALQIPFLGIVPQLFIYVAALAWLVTFLSMLKSWSKHYLIQ